MPKLEAEAKRRRVKLIALPTEQACQLLSSVKRGKAHAESCFPSG
jgi:hypothetical protein